METTLAELFASAEQGNAAAAERLFHGLYAELHRLAKRELRRNDAALTLGATTLLHEAFLDISARESLDFPDRARFMAYAARAMRGLIIDYVRMRQAQKRGGGFEITALDTDVADSVPDHDRLSRVSEGLDELAQAEPALAQVVDLKFFCGFSFAEIAAMRCVSERTVQRDWEKARIYLHRSPPPHWYTLDVATNHLAIAGNNVTFTITDGGIGDDDLSVNGIVVDPGGPGITAAATDPVNIPTLSDVGRAILIGLMAMGTAFAWRRRLPRR